MHDEKYGASGLEQSEPAAKFEMGGGSAHLDALSAGRDNEFVGIHSSNLVHTADVNSAMPGWDERPGLKLPGIDQPTSASPEPLWDMSPVASSSIQKRNNVSISRIFDDNNGRTAWVFLAALMITLASGLPVDWHRISI